MQRKTELNLTVAITYMHLTTNSSPESSSFPVMKQMKISREYNKVVTQKLFIYSPWFSR
jgi:hypothetical protein